jgi:uncharacterized ferritin-like protein (DUF455 family)
MPNRAVSAVNLAITVLETPSPLQKAEAGLLMRRIWLDKRHKLSSPVVKHPPAKPARPQKPDLVTPSDVPRRRLGSVEGRGALLHAIAHIELNAIDLAADMIARFSTNDLISSTVQTSFIDDWSRVCAEECKHFKLLSHRLKEIDLQYGDFPAHNGLWEAADATRNDIAARLAIAPMVLEARGLDVTPPMIKKMSNVGDEASVAILKIIYDEEIDHVRIGAKWFQYIAEQKNRLPTTYFHELVGTYFAGKLKPPFNVQARTLAGLTEDYYKPLANS